MDVVYVVLVPNSSQWRPTRWNLRLLVWSWYICILCVTAVYTAKIVSLLSVENAKASVQTYEELLANANYKPIFLKGTAIYQWTQDAKSGLYKDIWDRTDQENLPTTGEQAMEMLLSNSNYVYIELSSYAQALMKGHPHLGLSEESIYVGIQTCMLATDSSYSGP